jgi:hypothetical protein
MILAIKTKILGIFDDALWEIIKATYILKKKYFFNQTQVRLILSLLIHYGK